MSGFPSAAFCGFLTFCHEVCRSKEKEGESTFLSTKRDGGGGHGSRENRLLREEEIMNPLASKEQIKMRTK